MAVVACLFAALALGVTACGDDDDDGGGGGGGGSKAAGKSLTVYSSLPFQGANRVQSIDIVKAEKLALKNAGGKVGTCTLKLKSLDDATAQAGQWDAGQTSSNARKAAQDKSTIAYLGEFNSGASAISIPILSDAKVLQISPANTALELTKDPGPGGKGAPGKYYPSGYRNYSRVVPADHIQGAAQADWMKELGVKKLYILNDKQVYGAGVAKTTADAAKRNGITVLGNDGVDPKAANYRSLAQQIKSKGADAVFYGAIAENNAIQLFKDMGAALPDAKLFGPDGVAVSTFTKDLPPDIASRSYLTVATIDPKDYPAEGQKFFRDFKAKYGSQPETYGIYGYEAMSVLLDAMKRAGAKCNDRAAVRDALFSTADRKSVLGTYSIDKDGDTTLNDFGRYRARDGKLVFEKSVKVPKDSFGKPLGTAAP